MDKVVFITGSSIGIGRETAFWFAKANWKIVISYLKDRKEAEKTARKCKELGAEDIMVLNLDLRESNNIDKCVKEIVKKFRKIDVLINNAGVIVWKNFSEYNDKDIEDQIRINLEGLIKITKKCLPYIRDTIINIASRAGKIAHAGLSVYCATKFGVRGFSYALADELKGKIKVYCVNPTTTATRMTGFSGDPAEKVGEIIFNSVIGKYKIESGGEIDVWEL